MPFGDRTDRLVTIHPTHRLNVDEPGWGDTGDLVSPTSSISAARSSVEGIGGYMIAQLRVERRRSERRARARRIGDAGSVSAARHRADHGPSIPPEEAAAPGLESVVMLTHGLWQRRYGSDPAIIGKPIIVNDRARMVVGVLPPGFRSR